MNTVRVICNKGADIDRGVCEEFTNDESCLSNYSFFFSFQECALYWCGVALFIGNFHNFIVFLYHVLNLRISQLPRTIIISILIIPAYRTSRSSYRVPFIIKVIYHAVMGFFVSHQKIILILIWRSIHTCVIPVSNLRLSSFAQKICKSLGNVSLLDSHISIWKWEKGHTFAIDAVSAIPALLDCLSQGEPRGTGLS